MLYSSNLRCSSLAKRILANFEVPFQSVPVSQILMNGCKYLCLTVYPEIMDVTVPWEGPSLCGLPVDLVGIQVKSGRDLNGKSTPGYLLGRLQYHRGEGELTVTIRTSDPGCSAVFFSKGSSVVVKTNPPR